MTRLPTAAITMAQRFEGFHHVQPQHPNWAYPYRCPAGYWTIGYGHQCCASQRPLSQAQALAVLRDDLALAMALTERLCPGLALQPCARRAAIIDFTFNFGAGHLQTSTLRRRINQEDWPAVATELQRWVHAGGRVLPGLVLRRHCEAQAVLTPEKHDILTHLATNRQRESARKGS